MRAVVTIGMNRYGDDYARKAESPLELAGGADRQMLVMAGLDAGVRGGRDRESR